MKKGVFVFALALVFLLNFASASCSLTPSLINQDPYPAVPGDYVKLVFQVTGAQNPDCDRITFRLAEQYPISFDPGTSSDIVILGGTHIDDYTTQLILPYKVRVEEGAIDGENPIEFLYTFTNFSQFAVSTDFDLIVQDIRTNFEVHVKDYNSNTQTIVLEILNIGSADVQALTIEIPKQENIDIKGANREIVGDLDSNEYTTADFEATAKEGEIVLKIIYTDSADIRRETNKTVLFEPDYFDGLSRDRKSVAWWVYVLILGVIGLIAWKFYKRHKRKKLHQHQLQMPKK